MNFSKLLRKLNLVETLEFQINDDHLEKIRNLKSIIQPPTLRYKPIQNHSITKYSGSIYQNQFSIEKSLNANTFKVVANGKIIESPESKRLIITFDAYNKVLFYLILGMLSIFTTILILTVDSNMEYIIIFFGNVWMLFGITILSQIRKSAFKRELLYDIGIYNYHKFIIKKT